jgi:hypothetical protein
LRTEEAFIKILNRALITRPFKKEILEIPWVYANLRRLHVPLFKETQQLLPFAIELFDQSIKDKEYKKNQWKVTMDWAQKLGAIKV